MTYSSFLFIPLGVYFITIAIKSGRLLFNQPIIFNEATDGDTFSVSKEGRFEIWVRSEMFKFNNLNVTRPLITEINSGKEVALTPSLLRAHSNNFSESKMHLFSFYAKSGKYYFRTTEETSLLSGERIVANILTQNKATVPVIFYIKHKPPLWTFPLFMFSIFTSIASILGGIILPFIFS